MLQSTQTNRALAALIGHAANFKRARLLPWTGIPCGKQLTAHGPPKTRRSMTRWPYSVDSRVEVAGRRAALEEEQEGAEGDTAEQASTDGLMVGC